MPERTALRTHPSSRCTRSLLLLWAASATTFGLPGQSCTPMPADVAACWRAEGDALDACACAGGTLHGSVTFVTGAVGQAFGFDGDDDRVTVAHSSAFDLTLPGFTAEFWVRGSSSQPQALWVPVDKSHGFLDNTGWTFQGLTATGQLGFGVGLGGGAPYTNFFFASSAASLLDDQWHHVAGTWDGSSIRMYVDAVLQETQSLPAPVNNIRELVVGAASGGGSPARFFRGAVDELSIYRRALTATEIAAIWVAGSAGKCTPLPPSPAPVPPGIASWWKGEDDHADSLGTSHGLGVGAPLFAAGQVNRGFVFDSDDDRISIPHTDHLNPGPNGFAVEFWMRGGPAGQPGELWDVIDKSHGFIDNAGWTFQGDGLGQLGFLIGGGGPSPFNNFVGVGSQAGSLLDGCWHHVAGTWDPADGLIRLYVDGVLQGTNALPAAYVLNNNRPLRFGHASGGGWPTRFFRGSLDEVSIYSRPLTVIEVQRIYAAGRAGKVFYTLPMVVIGQPTDGHVVGSALVPVSGSVAHIGATAVTSTPAGIDAGLPPGGGDFAGSVTLAGSDGEHAITLTATDPFDNTSGTSVTITLDTTPPVVTVDSPLENAVVGEGPITLSVSVADLTGSTLSFGSNVFHLPAGGDTRSGQVDLVEGANAITVTSIDVAGHTTQVVRNLVLDLSAPLVAITDPPQGACFGSGASPLPVTARIDDLTSTVVSSSPAGLVGNLPPGGGTVGGIVALVEGMNTITVYATDASNRTSSASVTVVLDSTAPAVQFASPTDLTLVRGSVDVQITAADPEPGSGMAAVDVHVDGSLVATLTSPPFTWNLPTTSLADGEHVLRATATDGKGNRAETTVRITVDNTPPVVTITSPAASAVVSGPVPFEGNASDTGSGLTQIVQLVGGLRPTTDASASFDPPVATHTIAGSEDTGRWPDGPLVFTLRAIDAAGNQTEATVTTTVSHAAATPPRLTPRDGKTVRRTIQIRAHTQDPGFASLEIKVDGQSVGTSTCTPFAVVFDTATRLDGPMSIEAVVRTSSGGVASTLHTVHVDNIVLKHFHPQVLGLQQPRAPQPVLAHLDGMSLPLLLPREAHAIELRVPGGNAVQADTGWSGDDQLFDSDSDHVPELLLRFDRRALSASITAGIAAGRILPNGGSVRLELWVDGVLMADHRISVVRGSPCW